MAEIIFDEYGVAGYISHKDAEALGKALSILGEQAKIAVMSSAGGAETAEIIANSAASVGCEVSVLGHGYYPVAQFASRDTGADCLVYVRNDSRLLLLCGGDALPEADIKRLSAAVNNEYSVKHGSASRFNPMPAYRSFIEKSVPQMDDSLIPFTSKSGFAAEVFDIALSLGAQAVVRNYGYSVSVDGTRADYTDEDGRVLGYRQLVMLAAKCVGTAYLGRETPRTVMSYLRSNGVPVVVCAPCGKGAKKAAYLNDAALQILLTEGYLAMSGMTSAEAKNALPEVFEAYKFVETDTPIKLIGGRGVRINYRGGSAAVYRGINGYRIFAEGMSQEIADEICDQTEKRIK